MNAKRTLCIVAGMVAALTSTVWAGDSHGHLKNNSRPAHAGLKGGKLDPNFQFTEIFLPADGGYNDPGAWSLNNNGTIVGNCNLITDFNNSPGLMYQGGVMTILPPAPFAGGDDDLYMALGDPTGINDSENAVGWWTDSVGTDHSCLYTAARVWIALPDPIPAEPGWVSESWAAGINNHGDIVGTASGHFDIENQTSHGTLHGYLLQAGQSTIFDVPSDLGFNTNPNGINDRGWIVGGYYDGDQEHGFLRQGNTYTTLDYPDCALPSGLVDAGVTVAGTYAMGINNLGQIVGYYSTSDDDLHGFLLSNGVFSTHDFPGTSANILTGINDRGEVSGVYNGGFNAYFGTPIHGNRH